MPPGSESAGADRLMAAGLRLAVDATSARVTAALATQGIDAMLLKGPVLERLLYAHGEPRGRGDSDLLVAQADYDPARAALPGLGFELVMTDESSPEWERHASTWRCTDPAGVVDLHWTLPGTTADPAVVWDALWRDHDTLTLAATPVPVPGVAACALHLALHVAQHGPRDAKAAEDLRRGLEQLDGDTWRAAAGLARRIGAVAAMSAGLRSQPDGATLADALDLTAAHDPVDALLAAQAPGGAMGFERLARTQGVAARARVLGQTLVPPAEFMRYYKPLARRGRLGLAAAYVVRPVDLARQVPPAWRAWRQARRP